MKYLLLAAAALFPCGAFGQGIVPSTGVVVTGAVTSVNGATGNVSVAARGDNTDITSLGGPTTQTVGAGPLRYITVTGSPGNQTINLHGGIATSVAGRYLQNFLTSEINGPVTGGPVSGSPAVTVSASFATSVMTAGTPSAAILVNGVVTGTSVPSGTLVTSQISGTAGGAGDYQLSKTVGTVGAEAVTVSVPCACYSQLSVVTTIGPNATWYELYGASFGMATTADATSPDSTNDMVALSSGIDQEFKWPHSRLYGASNGLTIGVNGRALDMIGYEVDNFLYGATQTGTTTGSTFATSVWTVTSSPTIPIVNGAILTAAGVTAGTHVLAQTSGPTGDTGTYTLSTSPGTIGSETVSFDLPATPYRESYQALAAGTHIAAYMDAAFTVECGGGAGNIGGCHEDLIDLKDLSSIGTPLNHPLQTTGSLIRSEGALTITNGFDLHNVTITGNLISTPTVGISGAGRTFLASLVLTSSIGAGNINVNKAEVGYSGTVATDTSLCGSMVSAVGCLSVEVSNGSGSSGSNPYAAYIPLINGVGGSLYTLPAATNSTLGGVIVDGTTLNNTAGAISVHYGTAANTAAQGNDSRFTGLAYLGTAETFTAAQRGQPATLAISGVTFTPNFDTAQNFSFTLVHGTCPCTFANPSTTPVAGQSGMIAIAQSGTPSDTIGTWGSDYKFSGANAPTLSTSASAVDFLPYYVFSSTQIVVGAGVLNAH